MHTILLSAGSSQSMQTAYTSETADLHFEHTIIKAILRFENGNLRNMSLDKGEKNCKGWSRTSSVTVAAYSGLLFEAAAKTCRMIVHCALKFVNFGLKRTLAMQHYKYESDPAVCYSWATHLYCNNRCSTNASQHQVTGVVNLTGVCECPL